MTTLDHCEISVSLLGRFLEYGDLVVEQECLCCYSKHISRLEEEYER